MLAAQPLRTLDDLPAPPPLPLVGNAHTIDVPRMHEQLESWDVQYGPVFTYRLGRQRTLCVSDPALINRVYRERPQTYRRLRVLADVVEELAIRGVFTAESAAWLPQRKVALRALHPKHLDAFFPTLRALTLALRDRWLRADGAPTDVQHDFMAFTIDVTTKLAFAHDGQALADAHSPLLASINPIFPALSRRIVSVIPTWRYLRLPADRRLEASVAQVRGFLNTVIASARAEVREGAPANFLEAMLDATDGAGEADDATLFGNAMTMLLAGEDTTANSLAWAVHLLLDHPEVLTRLRDETAASLAGEPVAPTRDATRVPYVDQVIHETMRLKSVGPMLFFESCEAATLGDIAVPADCPITLLTRRPSLNPDHFPDPLRFDPGRWSDPTLPARLQKDGTFTPFGSGPRLCPGRELALLEMRLVLPMLAHGFDVERVGPASDVREVNGFTMAPSGVRATLSAR